MAAATTTAPGRLRVLVIEDERDLADVLKYNLQREGYDPVVAHDGAEGLRKARTLLPDLILLDVMLPGMSGLDVCRELRRKGLELPIIMLTARAEEIDRVLGLEIGADDYVTKPFSMRELLARIRVRLRRHPPRAGAVPRYRFGDIEIDFEKFRASRNGAPLDLTPREYDILHLLVRCRGEVVTRDRMLNEVWGYDDSTGTRTVDTHILKLRQKLEADSSHPQFILSIYGEGYKFVG